MQNTDYDWCLFHTRLASVGEKNDNNCHPFRRGDFVLAMNGTEKSVSFVSKVRNITDTEAIIDIANKYNLGLTALKNFSSIFMGFYKGKPFVVADNTYSIRILKNNKTNAIVFASNFPLQFKNNIFDTTSCFTWNGGRLPSSLIKHKKRYYPVKFWDDYLFSQDIYGQYYFNDFKKDKGGTSNVSNV